MNDAERRLKKMLIGLAVLALVLPAPMVQAGVIIDLFTIADNALAMDMGVGVGAETDFSSVSTLDGSILGDQRDLFVSTNGSPGWVLIQVGGMEGMLFEGRQPDLDQIATVTWDGDADTTTTDLGNALGADLSGENRFFLGSDGGGLERVLDREIELTLWDGDSNSTALWTLVDDETEHFLSFSAFSGIDFSAITAIEMSFLTDDISLSVFSAVVPIPPAAGIALLGMVLVGVNQRRNRKLGPESSV